MIKKVALGGFILLIIAAIGLPYWFERDSKAKLNAIQEHFRASGAPMTMEDALPETVAPELNAAPLYLELEALIKEYGFRDAVEERLIEPSDFEIDDLYLFKLNEQKWEVVEEILADERLLAQREIIEAIVARPFFQPDWKYDEGPSMLIVELGVGRNAVDYLLTLAAQEIRAGDVVQANSYLNQVLVISKHFDQSPTIISYLTGMAIRGQASKFLEAATRELDDSAAFDLKVWSHVSHKYWNRSLDSERLCMGKVMFEAMINGDIQAFEKLSGEPVPAKFKALSLSPVIIYFRYDYVHYLRYFEVERFDEAQYYVDYVKRSAELEREFFGKDRNRYAHLLSSILIPALGKVREVVFKSDTQNVVNHTALQLSRYRRDRGTYPDSLEVLVPQYCDEVPTDLFNGLSLVYRKESDGFALYSVGPNMKDDGGVTNDRGLADDEHGDVIWAGVGSTLTRQEDD